jgi:hypothetical protein
MQRHYVNTLCGIEIVHVLKRAEDCLSDYVFPPCVAGEVLPGHQVLRHRQDGRSEFFRDWRTLQTFRFVAEVLLPPMGEGCCQCGSIEVVLAHTTISRAETSQLYPLDGTCM